jgi:hypothetical protein
MRTVAAMLALLCTMVVGACAEGRAPLDAINSAPPDTGPGCYDHKGRIEHTITMRVECEYQGWTWKP